MEPKTRVSVGDRIKVRSEDSGELSEFEVIVTELTLPDPNDPKATLELNYCIGEDVQHWAYWDTELEAWISG